MSVIHIIVLMLSTPYTPQYIYIYIPWVLCCGYHWYILWTTMLPTPYMVLSTSYIHVVHNITPTVYKTCMTHTIYFVVHSICPHHMFPTTYHRDSHSICPQHMYPTVYVRYTHSISPTLYVSTAYNMSSTGYVLSTPYTYGVDNSDMVLHGISPTT